MAGRFFHALSFRSKASLPVYLLLGAVALFVGLIVRDAGESSGRGHTGTAGAGANDGGRVTVAGAWISLASIEHGRALAAQHCQSCHLLPDPASLPAHVWAVGVLPHMAPRLGIFKHGAVEYTVLGADEHLDPHLFPSERLLTEAQWQYVIDYYVGTAPATLPPQAREHPIRMGLSQFAVEAPRAAAGSGGGRGGGAPDRPDTSLVKIVESGAPFSLIVSDAGRRETRFLDDKLNVLNAVGTGGAVVDVDVAENGAMVACNIGVLKPNNQKLGKAQYLGPEQSAPTAAGPVSLFENLQRPVQIASADFNNDGETDYLVCEFGYIVGGLAWMEGRGDGKFVRHELYPFPGATKAVVRDHNGDGHMDFWVLFSQGREGVFLFTNTGGGRFRQEKVLAFPAAHGSSSFELADFDADGHPDIVYTAGDNGDTTGIPKPYHGVYVFMNDAKNRFDQKYFFPINGCSKALARDFDGDGDLDLAAISFFPDYGKQPEEGFVFLRNEGGFDFRPSSLEAAKRGRWMTMDAGDIDRDGDVDLVLGNCSTLPALAPPPYDWKLGPAFLLLRNNQTNAG